VDTYAKNEWQASSMMEQSFALGDNISSASEKMLTFDGTQRCIICSLEPVAYPCPQSTECFIFPMGFLYHIKPV
jgi:hypothetical protein